MSNLYFLVSIGEISRLIGHIKTYFFIWYQTSEIQRVQKYTKLQVLYFFNDLHETNVLAGFILTQAVFNNLVVDEK